MEGEPDRLGTQILAARLAALYTRREAGYPLPRRTELARRFQATPAQIDAAVDELIHRGLLLRAASGQIHRAGPAEYLLPMDGPAELSSFIDPLGRGMTCADIRVSRRRAPLDVTEALGLPPGTQLPHRRCAWTTQDKTVATAVTYAHERYAHLMLDPPAEAPEAGQVPCSPALTPDQLASVARPAAIQIEIQPPARAIARLRLADGQAAIVVTARLDTTGPAPFLPAALTTLALHPEMFRLVLDVHPDSEPVLPAGSGRPDDIASSGARM